MNLNGMLIATITTYSGYEAFEHGGIEHLRVISVSGCEKLSYIIGNYKSNVSLFSGCK